MMGERLAYLPSTGFCLFLAAALFGRAPAAGARRAVLPALLAVYALVTLAQAATLNAVARESLRQTRAIVEAGRREPGPRRIFVVNGWFASSFWVTQATQWLSGGEAPPVTVLTLSPDLLPPSFLERHRSTTGLVAWLTRPAGPEGPPLLAAQDSSTLVARATGTALIGAPVLRFFRFGRRFAAGDTIRTPVLRARVLESGPRAIRFSFPRTLADPSVVWVLQDDLRMRVIDPRDLVKTEPAPAQY